MTTTTTAEALRGMATEIGVRTEELKDSRATRPELIIMQVLAAALVILAASFEEE